MEHKQKTYTQDRLIIVPREVFIPLEEAIQNPPLLEEKLEKLNGLENIKQKDEELWKYFTENERFFTQNYLHGAQYKRYRYKMGVAFVTGGLFAYSILELANEPEPLKRLRREKTIEEFNHQVELHGASFVPQVHVRIVSENPILWQGVERCSALFGSVEKVLRVKLNLP